MFNCSLSESKREPSKTYWVECGLPMKDGSHQNLFTVKSLQIASD